MERERQRGSQTAREGSLWPWPPEDLHRTVKSSKPKGLRPKADSSNTERVQRPKDPSPQDSCGNGIAIASCLLFQLAAVKYRRKLAFGKLLSCLWPHPGGIKECSEGNRELNMRWGLSAIHSLRFRCLPIPLALRALCFLVEGQQGREK